MGNKFSIPLLGIIQHTEQTREILTPYAARRKQSKFVRKAILKFAGGLGFNHRAQKISNKPDYISNSVWQQILLKQQKSYSIDYTYVIAFYWLKSLSQFQHYPKSKLIKEIIESDQVTLA